MIIVAPYALETWMWPERVQIHHVFNIKSHEGISKRNHLWFSISYYHRTSVMNFFRSDSTPIALRWRSNTVFIITTVAIGLFTDLFLYGLIVPVMPFMLRDRLKIPQSQIQSHVSDMLAAYAGASVISSIPAGWIADRTNTRQVPYLSGLAAILAATTMLALGQSVTVLIIARVFQGISAAVVWTVGLAIVLDTVGPKKLGTVIGTVCLSRND